MYLARRVHLALGSLSLLAYGTSALAKPVTPEPGTVYAALFDGLQLVAAGKFDAFIDGFCSKERLCTTEQAIRSVKQFNLPASQRLAPKCFRGADLDVTRVDGDLATDDRVKIFIQCDERGMPRPYEMVKEGGAWKFGTIY